MSNKAYIQGFSLLQLAMALVVTSLIVGAIVAGQDLIKSSEVRAQIAQINQYNSATATFVTKYEGLPGDIKASVAAQYGFNTDATCDGVTAGRRNGDWMIQGRESGLGILAGESGLFWQDLSKSGLIDQNFPNAGASSYTCSSSFSALSLTPGLTYVGNYFPRGKLGYGTFLYVYNSYGASSVNLNWYGLSALTGVAANTNKALSSTGISVFQAYTIDKKFDDSLPTSGTIQAQYLNNSTSAIVSAPSAASDTGSTCYNTTNVYSTSAAANNGVGLNCALSFQFQN